MQPRQPVTGRSLKKVHSKNDVINSYINELRNKLDYVLKDGTRIAISEENQILLNSLLKGNDEIVSHMSENKQNFMEVLKGVY